MRFLDKMERKLRPFAIPNLTNWLVVLQICGFIGGMINPTAFLRLNLDPQRIMAGEV